MGDDFPDIPVLKKVGMPCCPSDAIPEIFRNANFLTGNQLGKLGNVEQVPTLSVQEMQDLKIKDSESLQQQISHLTEANDLINAWKLMVANQN
jgi:3-deoxy-D-manno-octulosonate 8-phosphate phosphatase KdsC-like HAD superfamily phosphatase